MSLAYALFGAPHYPTEPPYKRRRYDVTFPFMKKTDPLVPAQPASPPPAHIRKAGMYENSTLAIIPDVPGICDTTQ